MADVVVDTLPLEPIGPDLRRAIRPVVALAMVVGLFWLQRFFAGPWLPALIMLCLIVPCGAFSIYLATIRRMHDLAAFADGSLAQRFLTGTWLRLLFGWGLALIGGLAVFTGLLGAERFDWLMLALAPGVYFACLLVVKGRVDRELKKPFHRTAVSLCLAVWPASFVLLLSFGALQWASGGVPQYASLRDAIAAGKAGSAMLGSSAIAAALAQAAGMWTGLQAYLLGVASGWGSQAALGALATALLLRWTFYFTVCWFVASFMVPRREYARVLAPLVATDVPPPISRVRLAVASAVAMAMFVGIYPIVVLKAESILHARPGIQAALEKTEVLLEKIDDYYVAEGTLEEIGEAAIEILRREGKTIPALKTELDAGFDLMKGNVDAYLDWYYSVFGEWGRIGHLLVGNAEEYLARRLEEKLAEGAPFARLDGALKAALDSDAAALNEFRQIAEAIIARNRVEPGSWRNVNVVTKAQLDDVLSLPMQRPVISFRERLGAGLAAGGVAGAVGGVVSSKVVAKLTAKGTVKVAAKALMEVAGERGFSVGAAGAGAAAGAIAGSAVPLVGTAAGAVIGGAIAGLAASLGTDYLMLKLEERISRETQKAEILTAIEEKRLELHRALERTPAVGSELP